MPIEVPGKGENWPHPGGEKGCGGFRDDVLSKKARSREYSALFCVDFSGRTEAPEGVRAPFRRMEWQEETADIRTGMAAAGIRRTTVRRTGTRVIPDGYSQDGNSQYGNYQDGSYQNDGYQDEPYQNDPYQDDGSYQNDTYQEDGYYQDDGYYQEENPQYEDSQYGDSQYGEYQEDGYYPDDGYGEEWQKFPEIPEGERKKAEQRKQPRQWLSARRQKEEQYQTHRAPCGGDRSTPCRHRHPVPGDEG